MIEAENSSNEFVISRVFNASLQTLWNAWTKQDEMKQWFGPKGFATPYAKMDFRIGGVNHYCQESPEGSKVWGKATYKEIVPKQKIVYINAFSNEKGELTRHPFAPNWPLQLLTTILFEDLSGKTKITVKWIPINPTEIESKTFKEAITGMQAGWGGTFEQLEEFLAKRK